MGVHWHTSAQLLGHESVWRSMGELSSGAEEGDTKAKAGCRQHIRKQDSQGKIHSQIQVLPGDGGVQAASLCAVGAGLGWLPW